MLHRGAAATRWAAMATAVLLLAGCAGAPGSDLAGLPDGGIDVPGGGLGATANATAPTWKVGQWWDHRAYIGATDTTGFVVKAIVVENTTAGYRLATNEPINAAMHAAFYFHDQGVMSATDWTVRDFAGSFQFPWYKFPLSNGMTWKAQEENLDFQLQRVSRQLTMTATAIEGTPGAFLVEARDPDGGLRARWDYQPSLGWFAEYRTYPPGSQDPEAYNGRLVNEAQGQGWTGTYYTASADFLLNHYGQFSPAAPSPPPAPTQFTISTEHTQVLAVMFSYAVGGGGAHGQLVAPDGQHWETYSTTFPNGSPGPLGTQPVVYVPAVAGEWRYAFAGADATYAGGGISAFGVTMASGTLAL